MKQNSWARIAVILLCALLFVGVLVVNALAGAGRGEMRRTRLKTFWGFFFFICYALISACCLHNIDTLETLRKVMKEEQGGAAVRFWFRRCRNIPAGVGVASDPVHCFLFRSADSEFPLRQRNRRVRSGP